MDITSTIIKARAGLILDNPFFGSLALRLRLVEDATCETFWTNGTDMGYKPSYVQTLSLDQIKGVIAHEVLHCALGHIARRDGREHEQWNVACDLAINPLLLESNFVLPDGALVDQNFMGMGAEEIFGRLPPPKKGNGQGNGKGQGPAQDPGQCGEVRDAVNGQNVATPEEMSRIAAEWKVAATQAAAQAKGMGSLPGGLERTIKDFVEPKLDWRAILARFIQSSARNDYQWMPPNRRFVHMGFFLPSLRSDNLGDVVVVVDTSGSISDSEVAEFAGEISAILADFDTTTHVVYCDTGVASVEQFQQADLPLKLHPKGGGGTDFKPPFRWVTQKGIEPSCLLYFTDLYCSSYPPEPDYPVLWVATGRGRKPPFGEDIRL